MSYYLDPNGNYYEGDPQPGDIEVPERPAPDAQWQNGAWVRNLKLLQSQACDQIDQAAGKARGKYITTVDGQEEVYNLKIQEAQKYTSASSPVATDYPHLNAEATETNDTIANVANLVINTYNAWLPLSAKIEGYRRGGNVAVNNATDPAGVQAALDVALVNLAGC